MDSLFTFLLLSSAAIAFCLAICTGISSAASILFAFSLNTKVLFDYWKNKAKSFWKYTLISSGFMIAVYTFMYLVGMVRL